MKEYKKFQEAAALRDHRKIGEEQKLFFFDKMSPGSCFFLPHGSRIYNKLMELIRVICHISYKILIFVSQGEYTRSGYSEVITPNVYNLDLWKTSGHLENYKVIFIFYNNFSFFSRKICLFYKLRIKILD